MISCACSGPSLIAATAILTAEQRAGCATAAADLYLASGRSRLQCLLTEASQPGWGPRPDPGGRPGCAGDCCHDLVVDRQRQEAADGPLAALVVGVEQLHRPRLARLDGGARLLVAGRRGVAERPLPETDVAHRYVQVPGLPLELLQRRVIAVAARVREEPPALQHRDPVARVAQRDRQVDDRGIRAHRAVAGADLADRAAPGDLHPLHVAEVDLQGRVLPAGRGQHRPQLDQQLLLGHLGHQVGRSDRRERGHGQDQRAQRGGQVRDRAPLGDSHRRSRVSITAILRGVDSARPGPGRAKQ